MNILQLCHKPPFPAVDGGAIAMFNITEGLINAGHRVKVLAVATDKHPGSIAAKSTEYCKKTGFEYVHLDTSIKFKDAFLNLFNDRSYNIERFISLKLEDKILQTIKTQEFDLILLEGLYVAPYINAIKKIFKGKIILRTHNIEHKIWERMSENSSNIIKKQYLSFLAERLKKFEIKSFKKVDGICALTQIDAIEIQNLAPEIPCGVFSSGHIPSNKRADSFTGDPLSVFHIAAMNWQPNQEAVDWLLDKIWPQVQLLHPKSTLHLAGRSMPERYYETKISGVNVVGEVPDAADFYSTKNIMLVPLKSGSGMRIKIIEGMALGKVIISTSVGAEGIAYTDGINILIADSPEEFVDAIDKCLKDQNFSRTIGLNAQQLIAEEYNNDVICSNMVNFINTI